MANTLLTPTAVTNEALRILHQKANFLGTIDRQYDDSYAKTGAKIGDSLKIRLPNQFVTVTGPSLSTTDVSETSVTLTVGTQRHVDFTFSSSELALSIDDFSDRYIQPAISALVANVEYDVMGTVYKQVFNQVNNVGTAMTLRHVLQGKKILDDNLAPTSDRVANIGTTEQVDLVDQLKGLFQDSTEIAKQYREGMMGRAVGFDFYQNTLWPRHTSGTATTTLTTNGGGSGATVTVGEKDSGTLVAGDIVTIDGLFRVHPESKATTTTLQQLVVTAAFALSATSLSISPTIVGPSGSTVVARQNVATDWATGKLITKVGTSGQAYNINMLYHKKAFAFATADLPLPEGIHWGARRVLDGVSMRVIRQYDIHSDRIPCRIDILYGSKAIRPEWACRLANN